MLLVTMHVFLKNFLTLPSICRNEKEKAAMMCQ